MKNMIKLFLLVFIAVFCCVSLVYLWGPSFILYSSPLLQSIAGLIKPAGSIILAVLGGFIFLKAMRP